mmetsp:Transcript_5004/g.14208  ORF Transcript_5004/g.14208 Transcript_5004/m.14208 type:complete len:685 (+) Transcript_5004:79-2133(+)
MDASHQRAPAEAGNGSVVSPLLPPAPSGPSDGGHGGTSPRRRDDRRTSPSIDRQDDESASPPTMHTPMLTHYVHLPDLHKRELDGLSLDSGGRLLSKTRSFPRRDRIKGRPPTDDGNSDVNIGRSRSKSMGNEHERIYGSSYQGYRLAEDRLKKSKSYGGGATSISSYVLSRYGRNEEVEIEDETTYLLEGSGEDRFEDSNFAYPQTHATTNIFANEPPNPPSISITYGLINSAIVLPVLISFGSIIYHDDFFRPYIPLLVKLCVVSGTVHQICFSTFSSLPFAVGQVQDAGLIFLSKMASDLVRRCKEKGHDDDEILATVTIGLGLCTALLGLGLLVIGYFKLASTVQLLPTPVVGGYLAFIGFFCGQGGLSIQAGVEVSGILQWGAFFTKGTFKLLLPGLFCGIMIYVLVRRIKHMVVLPCCICGMCAAFYLVLLATGTTLEEARDAGWVSAADDPPPWYLTWTYLRFDKVVWSVLPPQIPTLIGMTFVVALSSSLDVAAIELELKRPLDYNHELSTVGLSNCVSGLSGGYTGSYIFSQSIFSLRAGIRSRLSGYVLAVTEAIIVVLPVNVLKYVPLFFFGSLLVMICVDLVVEWLWEVRLKMSRAEYSVSIATFVLIMILGVEWGILAGIGVHVAFDRVLGLDMGDTNANAAAADTGGAPITAASNAEGDIGMAELEVDPL